MKRRGFFKMIGAAISGSAAAMSGVSPVCPAKAENYNALLQAGRMSINDVRRLENLNPLPADHGHVTVNALPGDAKQTANSLIRAMREQGIKVL